MKNSASVVNFPKQKPSRAPRGLKDAGRELWKSIQDEYAIDDPGGLSHLLLACRALDHIIRMQAKVEAEGDMITDRFGQPKAHPLLAEIARYETIKRQALGACNLDIEPLRDKPGRPPGRR